MVACWATKAVRTEWPQSHTCDQLNVDVVSGDFQCNVGDRALRRVARGRRGACELLPGIMRRSRQAAAPAQVDFIILLQSPTARPLHIVRATTSQTSGSTCKPSSAAARACINGHLVHRCEHANQVGTWFLRREAQAEWRRAAHKATEKHASRLGGSTAKCRHDSGRFHLAHDQ